MVLPNLNPTYVALGTIKVRYTLSENDGILTATATCSATGPTQSVAFDALKDSAADAVANAVPVGANIKGYDLCNTGITISYNADGVIPESAPLYRSHPNLQLTGEIRNSNATTGETLLSVDPRAGLVQIGANQAPGTYAGNYDNSNDTIGDPLFAVSGSRLPNAVFTIVQDAAIGEDGDIKNYSALGARRTTKKYEIAETTPTINSGFGALFGASIDYEVEDKTGNTWKLGNTSFCVDGVDANGNPLGAFSVGMVRLDNNNNSSETCNFRIRNDGTTWVKGLNINDRPVTIEPGTGYLTVRPQAEV